MQITDWSPIQYRQLARRARARASVPSAVMEAIAREYEAKAAALERGA